MADSLQDIFNLQAYLMDKMHDREVHNGSPEVTPARRGKLIDRTVQNRLHELFGYTVRELAEAMQHLKNKPWRDTLTGVDKAEFYEELVDTFHFFVEMCITAGMTYEDLRDGYLEKHQENLNRQDNGY